MKRGPHTSQVAEERFSGNFAPVLSWTVLVIGSLVALITWLGGERKGADLSSTESFSERNNEPGVA